jgi:diaminopimelate epimerase
MNIRFIKLETAGNDHILIDLSSGAPGRKGDRHALARAILKRRRGVGGSALLVLDAHKGYPAFIRSYSPSGEETAVGNDALVCAARYLFDSGRVGTESFSLMSASGAREVQVLTAREFRITLGKPRDPTTGEELAEGRGSEGRTVLEAQGRRLAITAVELDRPYAILFSSDSNKADLESLQRSLLPLNKGGKDFCALAVRTLSRDTLALFAERDARFDGISATGAALAAAALVGFCEREATFIQGSGIRYADWDEASGTVSVTASADYVFEGEWYQEESEPGDEG